MFQRQVNVNQAPGIPGTLASTNPAAVVVAGAFALVAAAGGALVGGFNWVVGNTAQSFSPGGTVPDGFLANELQAENRIWLTESSMIVPQGQGLTLYERGDFWATAALTAAIKGQKVFANLLTGKILTATAGSFPTNAVGQSGSCVAAVTAGDNTLTVASVSGATNIQVGDFISGLGLPIGTYIYALGSGTGGAGTYYLTQKATITEAAATYTTTAPDSVGGASGATASFATNVMTVTVAPTGGAFAAGQLVQSAGVAAGTYILSQLTGTPGGTGTYQLSTSPGTITAQAAAGSAWIETPFFVKSPGNVGDVFKLGIHN